MTIEGPTSDGTPEVTPELTLAVTPDETPEAVSGAPESMTLTRRKFTRGRIIGIGAAAFLTVVVGSALAYALLSGGGAQPESVLPGDTAVFAKIDLNPKIGQRVNLVRLVSKFPQALKNFNQDDPIASVFNEVTRNSNFDWSQLKPWIGNRFAVGAIETSQGVQLVLVLAVTNESEMRYFFAKQFPDLKYFVASNFVVIGDSQETINLVQSAPSHLSDNANFKSDVSALGGDQLGLIWGELKSLESLYGDTFDSYLSDRGLGGNLDSIKNTGGRIALGFHATPDSLVTTFLTRGFNTKNITWPSGDRSGKALQNLPDSALAAVSIDGIGKALSSFISGNSDVTKLLDDYGVSTSDITDLLDGPIDLIALQSSSTNTKPLISIRLNPRDAGTSFSKMKRILEDNGYTSSDVNSVMSQEGSSLYLGVDKASIRNAIGQLSGASPKLGRADLYKKTVTESGAITGYFDIQRLLRSYDIPGNYKPLAAAGFVISVDKNDPGSSRATITLTLR